MYYVVTQSHSDKPNVDILARCRTIRGAARRLEQERAGYYRVYGNNTIFPARPWLQKSDTDPVQYENMAAHRAACEYEEFRDAQNWKGTPFAR